MWTEKDSIKVVFSTSPTQTQWHICIPVDMSQLDFNDIYKTSSHQVDNNSEKKGLRMEWRRTSKRARRKTRKGHTWSILTFIIFVKVPEDYELSHLKLVLYFAFMNWWLKILYSLRSRKWDVLDFLLIR